MAYIKKNVLIIPEREHLTLPGSMSNFLCYREHDQKAMCLICRESVADLKRYNVKRHYDLKHKKCFDGAYVGKEERMKEFNKRLGRDEESICVYRHFKPS